MSDEPQDSTTSDIDMSDPGSWVPVALGVSIFGSIFTLHFHN
mgnify:CR=1 FL=1